MFFGICYAMLTLCFLCDQQDEFLMETQTRLRSEITRHCLANVSRSHLAMETCETLPAEADERADSAATA